MGGHVGDDTGCDPLRHHLRPVGDRDPVLLGLTVLDTLVDKRPAHRKREIRVVDRRREFRGIQDRFVRGTAS